MPKKLKKSLSIIERRRHVVELRRSGATLESIARVVSNKFGLPNYDRRRCHEDLQFALAELGREYHLSSEALRQEQLQVIDRLQFALWEKALAGDVKAIDAVNRLLERKAKLCGLDAPVQLLVTQCVEKELRTFMDIISTSLPMETYKRLLEIVSTFTPGDKT
ncbi:MAG: hypothetical protein HC860_26100 [Alkalinema sp. RU_4_3]|nr:hypothetical protein [Alkalinema sp. RU_4_3]